MKYTCFTLTAALAIITHSSHAELVASFGYRAESIYSTAGSFTTLGGLDWHNNRLYSGKFTEMVSVKSDGTEAIVSGAIPRNAGNSFVNIDPSTGRAFTAFTTSYSAPAPGQVGYMNGGTFISQTSSIDGAFDAARTASGNLFLCANDDINDDDTPDGSRIYLYDQANGGVTEVANLGGASGGLAINSAGDLYYAAYDQDQVLSFSAAQLANTLSGGSILQLSDADQTIDFNDPGYLTFDDSDQLYVSSWSGGIAALDENGVATTLALANGDAEGPGQIVFAEGALFAIDTDWMSYSSDIYRIEAVPEPGTLTLLALGGFGMVWFRRRRRYFTRP